MDILAQFAVVLAFLQTWILSVRGDIRCYCNLSVCVSTGYMCKSTLGLCYSEVPNMADLSRTRHGCVDLMPRTRHELCRRSSKMNKLPYLMCCQDDMCNYSDSLDINIQVHTKSEESDASLATPRDDLWFKAAVIAVPIGGICVLIMLVFLAMRWLKKDTQQQRVLYDLRRQRYFHEYCNRKNEANAKLNEIERENKLYKNVNVTVSMDSNVNLNASIKPINTCHSLIVVNKIHGQLATPV